MTAYELFAALPAAVATEIIEYSRTNDRNIYRAALDAVAQIRRVRIVFLERQPRTERHALMVSCLGRPNLAVAADSLIRNWLLKKHTGLLADFLDGLGVKHEKGVVEDLPKTVDDTVLKNTIDALLAKHPAEAVAVYLHSFNAMNAESWSNLEAILGTEPRLKLKPGD